MMKKTFFTFATAVVAGLLNLAAFGVTWYVSPTGTGDGTTEATPCNLATGWAKLTAKPTESTELVLADGEYKLTTQLAEVDVTAAKRHDITYTVRSKSGIPGNCKINGQSQCRMMKFVQGAQNQYRCYAVVSGIKFMNGKYTSASKEGGGALYFQGTLDNCIIDNSTVVGKNNYAFGGGIYCDRGSVITNCVISNCKAEVTSGNNACRGGGIYTTGDGELTIVDTQILNCSVSCLRTTVDVDGGGGINSYSNLLKLRNVLISGCTAVNNNANKLYVRGGGIFAQPVRRDVYENVKITGCSASGHGGALYQHADSAGIAMTFRDCTFSDNTAGYDGGAVCINKSMDANFERCLISGNKADKVAAIAMGCPTNDEIGGVLTMTNCIVRGNIATGYGLIRTSIGATIQDSVFEGNSVNTAAGAEGGLFYCRYKSSAPKPHLYERLIIRNNDTSGTIVSKELKDGIFRISNQQTLGYTNITVRNCYIVGNTATAVASVYNGRSDLQTEDEGYGIYFQNCSITGNDLTGATAFFYGKTDNTPSLIGTNVRNCDLRNNTGCNIILSQEMYALNPRKVDHCAVDAGSQNVELGTIIGNLATGDLAGRGAYMPWMKDAVDCGDGTYTETDSSSYGVTVAFNNRSARVQGAKVDIGARETNEGGSFVPSTFDDEVRSLATATNAIVMVEGETYDLPALADSATYRSVSDSRFLSINGSVITANGAGIGVFKAYNRDGVYLCTVPVYILPAGRTIGGVYIFSPKTASSYPWSAPATWVKVGSEVNAGFPNGVDDFAFVPCERSGLTLAVDGSYSLASLYCSFVRDSFASTATIRGEKADGTASLAFYGTDGKYAVPACFMAANQSPLNVFSFYPRGTKLAESITFEVAKGVLEIDCGGPTDKVAGDFSDAHIAKWYNDNAFGGFRIPDGSKLRVVNGVRASASTDALMSTVLHLNLGGEDVFRGSGTIEFCANSLIALGNNSLRSFAGLVRSQTLNYIAKHNGNHSGILYSVNVNATNVSAEINGYVTRDFIPSRGVGAWISGNSYHTGEPNALTGNGLPAKKLVLNGGQLMLLGWNRTGTATTFWPHAGGGYEAHYEVEELSVGKGLSHISNAYSATAQGDNVISHLLFNSVTHADPCGTLRVSDDHFRQNMKFGLRRTETTIGGWSDHVVGYKGKSNLLHNIFPIVPWAIGNSNGSADMFWWLGFDENGNVIRNGNRDNIDRNTIQKNQNAYVSGDIDLDSDKEVNSLLLANSGRTQTLGAGRVLTISSGALGLESSGTCLGTQAGGDANGSVEFLERAFVFATASSESNPNQIWSKVSAPKGLVSGYCGNLLLAGDQSGIKGELTVNNGMLQLGSLDGADSCQLGVGVVRAVGGNTVIRINKSGSLAGKTVKFDCPAGFSPKFKLQNTEPEICRKLYIDGKSVKSGTWGATGSGAANIDDEHFTGTGQLTIANDDSGVGFSMIFRP